MQNPTEAYVPEHSPEAPWSIKCVASTSFAGAAAEHGNGDSNQEALHDSVSGDSSRAIDSNYFKSAQWSPDGTTIITNSADNNMRSFVLPPDLLDDKDSPHTLAPYHTIPSTEPVYSTAIYPFYELQEPSTTLLLSSPRDHPIRINSALYPGLLASYSLICPTTEAFTTPHSLLYPASLGGTHFLSGSDSLICLFDVSRPGKDGPVTRLPTIPSKRKKLVGGGVGMKGIVSAMAIDPSSRVLAAGTFTRHIGLYGDNGSGDMIATFSIADTEAESHIGGRGITQVLWSQCGRYLYIAERKSDGILVYDIRVTGQLVGWLEGRKAMTNQRLNVDIVTGNDGTAEIWAGGTDGVVRMWTSPSEAVGGKAPTWGNQFHDDPVSSVAVHPMGNVMATCSGQKQYPQFLDENDDSYQLSRDTEASGLVMPLHGQMDNNLNIWQL